MRWHRPGLRAQLVLALLATSAVTLAAAVATLVPAARAPPRQRPAARHARAGAHRATSGWRACRAATCARARRARTPWCASSRGAWAGAWRSSTPTAIELADTDPERREPRSATPERLVDAGFARAGDVRDQVSRGEAVVVAPVRTRAGPAHAGAAQVAGRQPRRGGGRPRGRCPWRGGVAILLAAALGIALGFGLLRRLERLRRDARRLADEGIEQPLALDAYRDEVGEVALALETMRSRLHAEERGRQAFLATASHELRTPLASLRGTVELLEEELARGAPDLGGVRRRAAAARRQTDRMTSLAEDLLDLGRLDGDAALAREPVELARAGRHAGGRGRRRRARRGRRRRARRARAGVGRGRPAGDRARAACPARERAAPRRAAGSVVTIAVDSDGRPRPRARERRGRGRARGRARADLRALRARRARGRGLRPRPRHRARPGPADGRRRERARGAARRLLRGDAAGPAPAPAGAAQDPVEIDGHRAGSDRQPGRAHAVAAPPTDATAW